MRTGRLHLPMSLLAMLALLCSTAVSAGGVRRYTLDGPRSAVSARVAFFGLASKTAGFPEVSGGIALDPARLDAIALDVTLDARAITAGDAVTLGRLKGPNFFDVDRYPTIRFAGRTMRMTGQLTADVSGDLTARGVTRRETLRVTFASDPARAASSGEMRIRGTMEIDRRKYGMTAYSLIVGNKVTISINARMVSAQVAADARIGEQGVDPPRLVKALV